MKCIASEVVEEVGAIPSLECPASIVFLIHAAHALLPVPPIIEHAKRYTNVLPGRFLSARG